MKEGARPVESIFRVSHSTFQFSFFFFFYILIKKSFYFPDEEYETAHTFSKHTKCFFVLIRHRQFTRDETAYIFSVYKTFIFSVVLRAYDFNPLNFGICFSCDRDYAPVSVPGAFFSPSHKCPSKCVLK